MLQQKHLFMIFCLLLWLPVPTFATSIVAIIEDRSITIAADGVLLGNSRETGSFVRTSVCKIRCVDRLCFAASGRYNNDTIEYNLFQLAEKELHRAGTPKEISGRFKGIIDPLMPRLVAVSQKETPQQYDEWLKGRPVLSYFFAGFDRKGESLIVNGEVKIDVEGRAVPIQEFVRRGQAGTVEAVLLGWNKHIMNFMNKQPEWATSAALNPSEFAERMVRVEIEASENDLRRDVSEPIAIVSLSDKVGFNLESRGACQETP